MYKYFPFVVLVLICDAKPESNDLELKSVSAHRYSFTGLVQAVKRSSGNFITDHGYGSRLEAGRNVANAVNSYNTVFGIYGPGKRSVALSEPELYALPDDDRDLQHLEPSKRYTTDYGYGSRLAAGRNVADAMTSYGEVFGKYGPGKRSVDAYEPVYDIAPFSEDVDVPELSKRYKADYGYGSRVSAAEDVSNDRWVQEGLFSILGPGKRSGFLRLVRNDGTADDVGYV